MLTALGTLLLLLVGTWGFNFVNRPTIHKARDAAMKRLLTKYPCPPTPSRMSVAAWDQLHPDPTPAPPAMKPLYVLECDSVLSDNRKQMAREHLQDMIGDDNRAVILDRGMKLRVFGDDAKLHYVDKEGNPMAPPLHETTLFSHL